MTQTATHLRSYRGMTAAAPIRITGLAAADIASHARAYVRPGSSWAEVQQMRHCGHGCKLYVRTTADGTEYRLFHSTTYGCPLGRDAATREVPVAVEPTSGAEPGDYVLVDFGSSSVEGEVTAITAGTVTLVDFTRWVMGSGKPDHGHHGEEATFRLDAALSVDVQDRVA